MNDDLKAVENPVEILRALEAAASPAPWKPNRIHETEGDGAWGAGPLCEPSTPEQIKQLEEGDWCQDDQEMLADADATFIFNFRNLAPELIELWRVCNEHPGNTGRISIDDALDRLNEKAAAMVA